MSSVLQKKGFEICDALRDGVVIVRPTSGLVEAIPSNCGNPGIDECDSHYRSLHWPIDLAHSVGRAIGRHHGMGLEPAEQ